MSTVLKITGNLLLFLLLLLLLIFLFLLSLRISCLLSAEVKKDPETGNVRLKWSARFSCFFGFFSFCAEDDGEKGKMSCWFSAGKKRFPLPEKKKGKKPAGDSGKSPKGGEEKPQNKKTFRDRLLLLLEAASREDGREDLLALKNELGTSLLRHLPENVSLRGVFGFEDPSITGMLAGWTAYLYGLFPDSIDVFPDFTGAELFLTGEVKGSLVPARFLNVLICIFSRKGLRDLLLAIF